MFNKIYYYVYTFQFYLKLNLAPFLFLWFCLSFFQLIHLLFLHFIMVSSLSFFFIMSFSPSVNSFALSLSFWMFFSCLSHVSPHLFVFHTLRVFCFLFSWCLSFCLSLSFCISFSFSIALPPYPWGEILYILSLILLFSFSFFCFTLSLSFPFSFSLSPFLLTSSS